MQLGTINRPNEPTILRDVFRCGDVVEGQRQPRPTRWLAHMRHARPHLKGLAGRTEGNLEFGPPLDEERLRAPPTPHSSHCRCHVKQRHVGALAKWPLSPTAAALARGPLCGFAVWGTPEADPAQALQPRGPARACPWLLPQAGVGGGGGPASHADCAWLCASGESARYGAPQRGAAPPARSAERVSFGIWARNGRSQPFRGLLRPKAIWGVAGRSGRARPDRLGTPQLRFATIGRAGIVKNTSRERPFPARIPSHPRS